MLRTWVGLAFAGFVFFISGTASADPQCGGDALGAPCLTGLAGQCAYGRLVCPSQGSATCAPTPAVERCNGVDDDCDGVVDNGCAARTPRRRARPRRRQRPARAGVPG